MAGVGADFEGDTLGTLCATSSELHNLGWSRSGALPDSQDAGLVILDQPIFMEEYASLAAAGYAIDTVEAYEAVAEEELPPVAREALATGKLDGALHFSKRSATILAGLVRKADLTEPFGALVHACLSEDVATAVRTGAAAGAVNVTRRGLGTGRADVIAALWERVALTPLKESS